jgi:predicted RNase H-like HicB family nuclease
MRKMKKIQLQTIVWREGKHWVAQCLNVDVSSFGSTQKSALKNIKEALELYFEGTRFPKIISVKSPSIRSTVLQHV